MGRASASSSVHSRRRALKPGLRARSSSACASAAELAQQQLERGPVDDHVVHAQREVVELGSFGPKLDPPQGGAGRIDVRGLASFDTPGSARELLGREYLLLGDPLWGQVDLRPEGLVANHERMQGPLEARDRERPAQLALDDEQVGVAAGRELFTEPELTLRGSQGGPRWCLLFRLQGGEQRGLVSAQASAQGLVEGATGGAELQVLTIAAQLDAARGELTTQASQLRGHGSGPPPPRR